MLKTLVELFHKQRDSMKWPDLSFKMSTWVWKEDRITSKEAVAVIQMWNVEGLS